MSLDASKLIIESRPLRHADAAPQGRVLEKLRHAPALHGTAREFALRKGLSLVAFNLAHSEPFQNDACAPPSLVIVVLLECGGRSVITPCNGERSLVLEYTAGTTIYFLARTPLQGAFEVPLGTNFRGIELILSLDHLRQLGMLETVLKLDAFHPFCSVANSNMWIGKQPTTATARDRAHAILSAALEGSGTDLDMEVSGLTLLSEALDDLRAGTRAVSPRQRQRLDKLEAAKRLLLDDIAAAWKVGDVAAAVGLSEAQLKSGFAEQFGTPVYDFLQKARLEKAKALLARSDLSVTDVALAVGYANPSHFAFLFRRAYGHPPSGHRGTPARASAED